MDNTKKKNMFVGHAALLSANVMWGLMAPLGKDLLNSGVIPSMSLAALRIIAAALLFWSVSLLVPCKKRKDRQQGLVEDYSGFAACNWCKPSTHHSRSGNG